MRTLALVFCLACAAFAQSNGRTFHFANNPGKVGMQEILTTLRTVVNLSTISADAPAATITADGTPEQMQAVEWVIHQLDQPPFDASARPATQTASFGPNVYVAYFLKTASAPRTMQEQITAIRIVAEIQRIYNYTAPAALIMRGSASEMAAATWMLDRLDTRPASPAPAPETYPRFDGPNSVARVFYFPPTVDANGLAAIVTALRTTGQIMRVWADQSPNAIVLRDTAARVEIAQRIVEGWQKP